MSPFTKGSCHDDRHDAFGMMDESAPSDSIGATTPMTTTIDTAKVGRFTIGKSSPVRVRGKQGTWGVAAITQRDTGETFVDVVHATNGRSRVFPLDRIVYVRPTSNRGTLATRQRAADRTVANALAAKKRKARR